MISMPFLRAWWSIFSACGYMWADRLWSVIDQRWLSWTTALDWTGSFSGGRYTVWIRSCWPRRRSHWRRSWNTCQAWAGQWPLTATCFWTGCLRRISSESRRSWIISPIPARSIRWVDVSCIFSTILWTTMGCLVSWMPWIFLVAILSGRDG